MKKNIIFLLFIIFLFTGCSANYDLKINPNYTIEEKVLVSIPETEENDTKISNLISKMSLQKKEYSKTSDGEEIKVTYNHKYESIEDYILNSFVYKQVFDDIDIEKTKSKTILSTKADFTSNKLSINNDNNNNIIDYLQINIKSDLPVISENSDTMNQDNYTWIYNGKQLNKEINISYKNTPTKIKINSIVLIGVLFASISLMILIIYNRIKSKQKIH